MKDKLSTIVDVIYIVLFCFAVLILGFLSTCALAVVAVIGTVLLVSFVAITIVSIIGFIVYDGIHSKFSRKKNDEEIIIIERTY